MLECPCFSHFVTQCQIKEHCDFKVHKKTNGIKGHSNPNVMVVVNLITYLVIRVKTH
jgi:hypothetical protein